MSEKSVVIAGGSGFLGVSLACHLIEAGFKVIILSRNSPKVEGQWGYASWDGRTLGAWQAVVEDADAVVNLVYIASSPNPVSQVDFMRTLRKTYGVPIGIPATETMARWGARWILRTDPELASYGRYVQPQRLIESGFTFDISNLRDALVDLR